MEIGQIVDNLGNIRNYIKNLKVGDELIAKKLVMSTGDVGCSGMTYQYESFKKGKVYKVDHLYGWGSQAVAYVADEDYTCTWATPEIFDIYTNKV